MNSPASSQILGQVDFEALFQSLPGLYLVLAPDFTIVAASDAYLAATRMGREQLIGKNLFDVFPDHPADQPHGSPGGTQHLRDSFHRVLSLGVPDSMPAQRYDLPRPLAEGGGFIERHWALLNSPLRDPHGNVTHIIHRVQDVTENVRLRADQREREHEAHLQRQTESRLRELADAMPQIVWAARPDGFIDYFNRRWYEFTGLGPSAADPRANSIDQILHPDDIARTNETWRRSLRTGQPYEIEYRFRDRFADTGGYRWFLGRALPVRDEEGEIIRWYGTCTDISDQKLAEMELQRAKENAEAANKAKDQFLAVLSHELRTPLTPVLLTVSLLESEQHLPPEIQEDIQTIRRHVELEARLIDDLLDLTRITRGKMQLKFESADIHDLIRRTLEMCCHHRMDDIRLELSASHHHVKGDPARLSQILWNLLSNADKFTPAGKHITIRTTNPSAGLATSDFGELSRAVASVSVSRTPLRIEVIDQGVGIDSIVLPVIFNAFQQGDASLTRRFGGLGLGLTITRALVEAHDGGITARSAGRNQGSQFTVEFPTVPAPRSAEPSASQPIHHTAKPLRILFVEDHAGTLEIMTRLLRALGHQVTSAATVKDALAAAEQGPIDLVISDLALPDGSGHDVMRALKSRYNVKGIAVSGFGMDDDVTKSLEAGFTQHLTKPIDLERLREAIESVAEART